MVDSVAFTPHRINLSFLLNTKTVYEMQIEFNYAVRELCALGKPSKFEQFQL